MSDRILINGLNVFAHIGVSEEERAQWQRLEVTVELKTGSFLAAAEADDVALTVNYFEVSQTIQAIAQEKPRQLIETLAEDLAAAVLRQYAVKEIRVRIDKFIVREVRSVAVEIKRVGLKKK